MPTFAACGQGCVHEYPGGCQTEYSQCRTVRSGNGGLIRPFETSCPLCRESLIIHDLSDPVPMALILLVTQGNSCSVPFQHPHALHLNYLPNGKE